MQSVSMKAAVALAMVASGDAGDASSNPLGQVIALMTDLHAKVTKEGEQEEKAYKEYFEWCDDVAKNGQFAIKTAASQKEKLEATIAELSSNIEAGNTKIGELASDISTSEADLKSATGIREKESADFTASEKELVEVIDTLGRAVTILEREMQKNPAALAQVGNKGFQGLVKVLNTVVDAAGFSMQDKNRLTALMQNQQNADSDEDDEEMGAPAAANYKTHSSSIFDVLEDLKEKAEGQLSEMRKAETAAAHNYSMLKQSLEDQLDADKKDMDKEKTGRAAAEEGKAVAQGDLEVTVADLKTSTEDLQSAGSDCMTVAADHEATVRARAEELKVIETAQTILKDSTGGAVEQTYSFLQSDSVSGTGSAIRSRADLARSEVVVLVKRLAKEHHSAALTQLASRISAVMRYSGTVGQDPFSKVKGLIQDMLTKLEQTGNNEANEKAYCDEEMQKTAQKKMELDYDIEKLSTKIDQASAHSAELKAEVKELQAELATMAGEMAANEKWRQDAHAAYVEATSDLNAGLNGVRKALEVLRDYYATGSSLLQVQHAVQQPKPPQHAAAGGAAGSIIGILETVESDFATNLAKEETEEATAQEAHDKASFEYKITTTSKNQDVKYKSQEATSLDKSLTELSSDRQTSSTELDAVTEYFSKLKDRCIAKPETYEERKGRREAEISGLKEALKILENEAALVQKSGRKGHHMRGSTLAAF